MDRNYEPALTRDEIIQRSITMVAEAALNEWDSLPKSIAVEVMNGVIILMNSELEAINAR